MSTYHFEKNISIIGNSARKGANEKGET